MVAPFTTANELTLSLNCSLHTRIMHIFWYQLPLPSQTYSLTKQQFTYMCHALCQYVHVTLHVYHVQCTPYKQHCCLHVVQQCLHFTVSTRESTRNNTSGACRYDTVTLGRTIWLCKLKLAHNVETKQYTVWHNMLIVCSGTSLLDYKKCPLITCTCVKW